MFWQSVFSTVVLHLFFCLLAMAQPPRQKASHVVYLTGNTASSAPADNLQALNRLLKQETRPFTVLHLGDVLNNTGSIAQLDAREREKIGLLKKIAENGELLVLPGDKDWDNSGKNGLRNFTRLAELLDKELGENGRMLFNGGCPGPKVIDLAPHLRLIAFNSQWWVHPHRKPEAPDTECDILGREEFLEELEKIIEESGGKNILLAAHHPALSGGPYGGRQPLKRHLFPLTEAWPALWLPLPVPGSAYAAFRQNVGTPRDQSFAAYGQLASALQKILQNQGQMVYASAHDYSQQLLAKKESYQLVSGSLLQSEPAANLGGTLFRSSRKGFSRLIYEPDGAVWAEFFSIKNGSARLQQRVQLYRPACSQVTGTPPNRQVPNCESGQSENQPPTPEAIAGTTTVAAGPNYQTSRAGRFFFGDLHRQSWVQPVTVPFLPLDTLFGGLKPVAVGGGRQTTSLKIKAADGREFVFRSVNKDPVKALDPRLRETFAASLIREFTATQHPYGALPVSALLDRTDILHARPRLYVLPDHPALGSYRQQYAGLFGMLEDRPRKPEKGVPGFAGADDVDRSFTMFRKIYDDNDYRVDARAFAKARVFDILIGDWGRHEDNWKWALYKNEKGGTFLPVPRDRDHSFSAWDGLFTSLLDREWARPNVQHFDYEIRGIRSLTWPARHLDRLLLTSLSLDDWQQVTAELQRQITESAIDSAMLAFPEEIRRTSGNKIAAKLKARRQQLPQAVEEFFYLLAREVDVVGSNKHEHFVAERLSGGSVSVKVFKKKKEAFLPPKETKLLFERTFYPAETREIRLYGLGGRDQFTISGEAESSILLRVIGGPGRDQMADSSRVKGPRRLTRLYDDRSTLASMGSETRSHLKNREGINRYDRTAFAYDTYLPRPLLFYSSDDGLAFNFGLSWKKHGFREDEYKHRFGFKVGAGTAGTRTASVHSEWRHLMGSLNLGFEAQYADFFPYYNFFGLGNGTTKNQRTFDAEGYRTTYSGLDSRLFLRKEFLGKSFVSAGLRYENYQPDVEEHVILGNFSESFETENFSLAGVQTDLDLDFRDGSTFARRGFRLQARQETAWLADDQEGTFTRLGAAAEYYFSWKPVTLALQGGGEKIYGDRVPYFKYAVLGQRNHLRGYLRNRFHGTSSAWVNTELRTLLGVLKNPVLPVGIGIFGFYDTGRVWLNDTDSRPEGSFATSDRWHSGYGGGIFIVPVYRSFTFSVSTAFSEEESALLLFSLGFGIGR